MTSGDPKPETGAQQVAAGGAKKLTLASAVALVASIGGNVVQWQSHVAEVAKLKEETQKTASEIQTMKQDQAERESRNIQSWIEQLQKFDTAEDRVMVLSAAISTSPYDSVKAWAKEQMSRLEGELAQRKETATQVLALAEHATPAGPRAILGGGAGAGANLGHGAAGGGAGPEPATAVRLLASKNLERVNHAEVLLKAAKGL